MVGSGIITMPVLPINIKAQALFKSVRQIENENTRGWG